VVLDGGHIAEIGTHDELLAADGNYARLYHTQMHTQLNEVRSTAS
jgi:ABC-type multidrug transport system fused ATPase/permease subunit